MQVRTTIAPGERSEPSPLAVFRRRGGRCPQMEGADGQAEGALSKGASPARLGRSGQGGGVQHPRLARGHRRQKGVGGEDEADAISEDEPAPGWWGVTLWPAGLFVRAGVMMSRGRCGEA